METSQDKWLPIPSGNMDTWIGHGYPWLIHISIHICYLQTTFIGYILWISGYLGKFWISFLDIQNISRYPDIRISTYPDLISSYHISISYLDILFGYPVWISFWVCCQDFRISSWVTALHSRSVFWKQGLPQLWIHLGCHRALNVREASVSSCILIPLNSAGPSSQQHRLHWPSISGAPPASSAWIYQDQAWKRGRGGCCCKRRHGVLCQIAAKIVNKIRHAYFNTLSLSITTSNWDKSWGQLEDELN